MTDNEQRQRADLIEKIRTEIDKRLSGTIKDQARGFIDRYFSGVHLRDLAAIDAEALFGAALAHMKLGATRKAGDIIVRVYNPTLEEHGWTSDHTVVEVVCDDSPFLVDSLSSEFAHRGLMVHLLIHPLFAVTRDAKGALQSFDAAKGGKGDESFMHFEISEQSSDQLPSIRDAVISVMNHVRAAVSDWQAMKDLMAEDIANLKKNINKTDDSGAETLEFLNWLHDDHFTFLGAREYRFNAAAKGKKQKLTEVSAQGVLTLSGEPGDTDFDEIAIITALDGPFSMTKTRQRSRVHRPAHMDAIGIKLYGDKGKIVGERVYVGLFTSAAYNSTVWHVPLLNNKLNRVLETSGLQKNGHDFKALVNILETYPRDELFQTSVEQLLEISMGILAVQDRHRVAFFVRKDDLERFISCLIFVPRDRFSTELRTKMQDILTDELGGEVGSFYTAIGDSVLARLHVIINTDPGQTTKYDVDHIEHRLVDATRSWGDILNEALIAAEGEEKGLRLARRYLDAFPVGYREASTPAATIMDITRSEMIVNGNDLAMTLYRPIETPDHQVRFKLYRGQDPLHLSDVLPMLEHMGLRVLDERPYVIRPQDCDISTLHLHDFGLETKSGAAINLGAVRDAFQDAFHQMWLGNVESDGFNALVLQAGLTWREIVILRAYAKYLKQAGSTFSQAYMEETLLANPDIATRIVALFRSRFNPDGAKKAEADSLRNQLNDALDAVTSADEDRILRQFLNLLDCSLRTNYYQTGPDGSPKQYLSIKFNAKDIEDLPLPRPLREIFVYSPCVEGVHLRFGLVARGGLRWSDRREDFRTEILGLVKAQQVKNAVIVPVGSKGGFVVKRPPTTGGREAFLNEGIRCYKIFISGLLDLTDNIVGAKIVPPENTLRLDADDPYLVVAADKGTATFSDIANGVSQHYGFWLGDAFASGGSVGYDHKKMGITARGAWESVKRHFREFGHDTQTQPFSVVGVGDMSGDVFGNGMLLSEQICLIAAFNHMHIFVDPDPDPAVSFAERKRLFELPRSAWSDYDEKLISKGGKIFERSAKMLMLTPEIKRRFQIIKDKVTPAELMKAILTAQADLLWFGGIGTYVKSSRENHSDAGDRANDSIRVNAVELRCEVIGEGANLGVTQLGRIEFGAEGGRINTDSIDNSAGVSCSDHEVNIKILLDSVVTNGDLTEKQRNNLLASMTDEVAELVLRDNYLQTQAISLVRAWGSEALDDQMRLMRMLERSDRLNRSVEFLPGDEDLLERASAHNGMTRPEIAILIAYSKIWLYDELLQSDLPDDSFLAEELTSYFPTPLHKKYGKQINSHRLRREIIVTKVTNSMVNRVGGTFVTQFMEKTGMQPVDIARAYIVCRQAFQVRKIWQEIEDLDNKVPATIQTAMLADINQMIAWVTLWFLRNGERPINIGKQIEAFGAGIGELKDNIDILLPSHYLDDARERARSYLDAGVPESLALEVSGLVNLYSGCDIVRLAKHRDLPVTAVAKLYFAVGTRFRLGRLRAITNKLEAKTHWQTLAAAALIEEIYDHQLALTAQVLDHAKGETDPAAAISVWSVRNAGPLERTEQVLGELWGMDINDLSMIAVASRALRSMAGVVPNG